MPSKIEWTEETWNPITGCSAVSSGCKNCYAATMTKRLAAMGQEKYADLLNSDGHFNGTIKCHEDALEIPLRWKKPRVVFVNSMSDLFHANVPEMFLDAMFSVMALCQSHTFQVLTKRPVRAVRELLRIGRSIETLESHARTLGYSLKFRDIGLVPWPLPNVWLGTSIENQDVCEDRWDALLRANASVRWVSAEPLLGPVRFHSCQMPNWVVVGAESGPNARPMDDDWARTLRDQCRESGTAFFMKQRCVNGVKIPYDQWPEDLKIREYPESPNA